jgi:outer membrane protein assembly factor BamB
MELSTYHNLSEGYGQLYVVDDEDIVTAIDQQTGEVVWSTEDFKLRGLSAPLAFSNYLVFGDRDGYLHVIAQRDGRHLGRRKLDGDGIRSELVLGEGTVYVLGNSGSLHALNVELK